MTAWHPEDTPARARISVFGWALVVIRAPMLIAVTYGGLLVLLLVRLIERPFAGLDRPMTPYITQGVCRAAFAIMGMTYLVRGQPMRHMGAVVANHSSWLDIFTLNACQRVYFVSKSEVRVWVGIGWLARATGTVFIARRGAEARARVRAP